MSEQKEVKWLQGLKMGDDRAFKVLFEKYYASLCAFATNFVDDPDVAEDIVQEIFFKLYTDKPTFDVVVALKSYLYLATKNPMSELFKTCPNRAGICVFLKGTGNNDILFQPDRGARIAYLVVGSNTGFAATDGTSISVGDGRFR